LCLNNEVVGQLKLKYCCLYCKVYGILEYDYLASSKRVLGPYDSNTCFIVIKARHGVVQGIKRMRQHAKLLMAKTNPNKLSDDLQGLNK
jgi:hypothetical protein